MKLKAFLSLSIPIVFLFSPVLANDWVGSYDSQNFEDQAEARVYTFATIEHLRRPVSPRYIRMLDWQAYGEGRSFIQKGILFTFEALRSSQVMIAGDFNGWVPAPMRRNKMGIHYFLLPVRELEEGVRVKNYRYKFQVAGIWLTDPVNKVRQDDGLGGSFSAFELDEEDVNRQVSVRVLREKKPGKERLVEFAVHEAALARALRRPTVRNVSIVGDLNGWNPDHDSFVRGEDGIYRLRVRLSPGGYAYRLVADGNWILDPFNPNTRHHIKLEELCSYVEIQ